MLPPEPTQPREAQPIWEAPIPIEPLRPFLYDGCTDIDFPIHTSRAFARQVGLPGIILQCSATLAFAVRELVNREMAGNPLLLGVLQCRFTAMVRPGSEIRVQLMGKTAKHNGVDLHFTVLDHDGRRAVSNGCAFVRTGVVRNRQ